VISTGPKGIISKPFMRGEADLLTMHSSDGTTDLVVEGYGVNIRPWARNDLVILGPPADPAGIRGMKDGAAALKKIAETKSKILDTMGLGKREMSHKMWKKAGIRPRGDWVLKDEAPTRHLAPAYAAEKGAYLIYGRMPYMTKKIAFRDLEIMVTGDPEMRRPYMVMEANPVVFPPGEPQGCPASIRLSFVRRGPDLSGRFWKRNECTAIPVFIRFAVQPGVSLSGDGGNFSCAIARRS